MESLIASHKADGHQLRLQQYQSPLNNKKTETSMNIKVNDQAES